MNDPLISPFLIWLIGEVSKFHSILSGLLWSFGFISIFGVPISLVIQYYHAGLDDNHTDRTCFEAISGFMLGARKFLLTVIFISAIFKIILPTQATVVALAVNSQITANNVEKTADYIKDLFREIDVHAIVESVKDEDKK